MVAIVSGSAPASCPPHLALGICRRQSDPLYVAFRRLAEHAGIFPAELRRAFVTDEKGRGLDIASLRRHQSAGLQVNTHFKGVFLLTQALLPLINDGCRIVTISSGLARVSMNGRVTYGPDEGCRRNAQPLHGAGTWTPADRRQRRCTRRYRHRFFRAAWCATIPRSTGWLPTIPRLDAQASKTMSAGDRRPAFG